MEHDCVIGACDDEQAEHRRALTRSPGGPANPEGSRLVATNDVEDLDLDELTDQLEAEDLESRERHTLTEIRAALRRTKGKLERAFEDGKAAGRDEEQREHA
jgi:hypothetical protein